LVVSHSLDIAPHSQLGRDGATLPS